MENIVDARGERCPTPVILTKKALSEIKEGNIKVIVDNDVAKENVIKFAKSNNCDISVEENGETYNINIYKKQKIRNTINNNLNLIISSDKLGEGDEKLGKLLMKNFMISLEEQDNLPYSIIFINNGVKLTTKGSDVIDVIKVLIEKGIEIMSCGTCLDYYNLKDKLEVGTITNMFTIAERMLSGSVKI